MLMVGFEGHEIPDSLRELLDDPLVTGVVWFARNVASPLQVARVNAELREQRPDLVMAVDQEGGPVRRLKFGVPAVPAMREVRSAAEARTWGRVLAGFLGPLGFTMDLAPVLDVDSNPQNPIIGARSFGADPHHVASLGVALHHGLADGGLLACGKHFPGHGDTDLDSHLALPVLHHDTDRLWRCELIPFQAAISANIPALMSAHILIPALDPDHPATLSAPILQGLLRSDLGYEGLILSDDLEMKAVAERYPIEEIIERGLDAGIDVFLVCRDLDRQRRALAALRRAPEARLAQSLARLETVAPNRAYRS